MPQAFIHLNLHTEYSLLDGLVRVKPLVKRVVELGMPAVAIAEHSNLFSLVKFYRAAEGGGIKPIVGSEVLVHDPADPGHPSRLLLLCQDVLGYRQLASLVSKMYIDGQVRGQPQLHKSWLSRGDVSRLIALSGGASGEVGRSLLAQKETQARAQASDLLALFPDRFYLELQRTGDETDEDHVDAAVSLAIECSLPVVATNKVRFLHREDFDAHEARVCIHDGRTLNDSRRPKLYRTEQYLKSAEEMCTLFADLPQAIENSVEIAKRCNLELELSKSYLPAFPGPDGKSESEWFEEESRRGLEQRLQDLFGSSDTETLAKKSTEYHERLSVELEVINTMGFPGYFLIVADFISWAKQNGVPVGPGRGSGAGSLVAYALGITGLDPIEYDLLFERFLNPERVSLPDFDIDFCMDGRDRVIEYVTQRYGGNQFVAQIITFGTMAAKAVVRDVGRVLGHPYGFVDQLAKLVPFEIGMTLDKALAEEEVLRQRYQNEEDVRSLIDLALKLEGVTRNAGRHAGGVVIAPSKLTDFTALFGEQGATSLVTQLDKDDVESVGLVKFDFLGLRTLTIIDRSVASINAKRTALGEELLDIERIALDDEPTYELIRSCSTTAVFQFESRVMKELVRRLQPETFDDIIALNALVRPGPALLADDFIDRKHGRAEVTYLHEELEPVLRSTYGVILYQEQVMQIAQVLAGYTLGGADLLRRAMGKKKPEEMAKQRTVFVEGAKNRGVDGDTATFIFDLMEKFAGYGFNKSHSAAYALIAVQTAWLKTHYASDFMAAVLSADMDNTDKVVILINECRDIGLSVLAPDVNRCDYYFTPEDKDTVGYGLGAVKGVGQSAIESIVEERHRAGGFQGLFDFCCRIDLKKVNRRVLEALIRCGAMDSFGFSRAALMASLSQALQVAEQHIRDRSTGQNDLFGGATTSDGPAFEVEPIAEFVELDRLMGEKETLGLYLSGHPITQHVPELSQFVQCRLSGLRPGQSAVVAGLVLSVRTMNSRRGRMAVIVLDDQSARMEAVLYSDVFAVSRDVLTKDKLVVVRGQVTVDDVTGLCAMTVDDVWDLESARQAFAKRLVIKVAQSKMTNGFVHELSQILAPFKGDGMPVSIEYCRPDAVGCLHMSDDWCVRLSQDLLNQLSDLNDTGSVEVRYA